MKSCILFLSLTLTGISSAYATTGVGPSISQIPASAVCSAGELKKVFEQKFGSAALRDFNFAFMSRPEKSCSEIRAEIRSIEIAVGGDFSDCTQQGFTDFKVQRLVEGHSKDSTMKIIEAICLKRVGIQRVGTLSEDQGSAASAY